jgi:uncharacterized protein
MSDPLDYQALVRESLRGVVRRALEIVENEGLSGEHFFYISFLSKHPDVRIPGFLRDQHPDEVTIILQHQFWDLSVEPESFAVSLSFHGSRHRVVVPFAALTAFVDPSAEFGLRFAEEPVAAERRPRAVEPATPDRIERAERPERTGPRAVENKSRGADVVPFDPSRRR